MSMMEPFIAHPDRDETIAAADPGPGAPATAPGFGVDGEEPDVAEDSDGAEHEADPASGVVPPPGSPFRTPDPQELRRTQ